MNQIITQIPPDRCAKNSLSHRNNKGRKKEVAEKPTDFQKRVLATIEESPNMMANTWEIAWNGFAKEWNAKRTGHGALFRCILQAGQRLKEKGLIVILPPRDEYDTYIFCSLTKVVHPADPAG